MQYLSDMLVFARVVELGSFHKAADHLGVQPPAISKSVSRLERQLGVKLLHRTTRSLAVTEIGQSVYQGCADMANAAQNVLSLAGAYAEVPRGRLQVSAPAVLGEYWLAPLLPPLLARYPQLDLHVSLQDRYVDLLNEGVDVAIRIARQLPQGVVARPIRQFRYLLVARAGWLSAEARQDPSILTQWPTLHLGEGPYRNQLNVLHAGQARQVQLHSRLTINNSLALLNALPQMDALALVPEFAAAPALQRGELVEVLSACALQDDYAPRTIYAVYPAGRHVPLKVRVLIDHLLAAEHPSDFTEDHT